MLNPIVANTAGSDTLAVDLDAQYLRSRPSIAYPDTVPADVRVVSTDPLFIASRVLNGKPNVETQNYNRLPVTGLIVHATKPLGRNPEADIEKLLRFTPHKETGARFVPVRFAEKGEANLSSLRRMHAFAMRYAAAVQSGAIPVVIIERPQHGERIKFSNDPHVQAFFAGMVTRAVAPDGVLAVCSSERHGDSMGDMTFRDELTLAASQGAHALTNRRIIDGGPKWSHIGAQMVRFKRQWIGFTDKHGVSDAPQSYIWRERDPRSIHGDPRFAPHHSVLLAAGTHSTSTQTGWTSRMIDYYSPGYDHETNPARQIDAFRRWLVTHAASLGNKEVTAPVTLARPDTTPAQRDAADAAPKRAIA